MWGLSHWWPLLPPRFDDRNKLAIPIIRQTLTLSLLPIEVLARVLHIDLLEVVRPLLLRPRPKHRGRNRDEAVPGLFASVSDPGRYNKILFEQADGDSHRPVLF